VNSIYLPPADENLMDTPADDCAALRRRVGAGYRRDSYFGYARQDRKVLRAVPIQRKGRRCLITTRVQSRADRRFTRGQIPGLFQYSVDNLFVDAGVW